ncbi:hypothetical protein F5X96DRAFT_654693 [Biscogniauxia mediterranea]|nr:hypothetical protein F5X96DRAFT_654693 [Biscogniauxia mediterranea]
MSDARALLRAHRAENRIKHPHAAYSDAGKLLCKLCHETVKSESLWEAHIRGPNHKKTLQALQQRNSTAPTAAAEAGKTTADESSGIHSKRKHDDVDESMSDPDGEDTDLIRKKRSKTGVAGNGSTNNNNEDKRQTSPALGRRTSGTPVQGVEIAIPSRPATPLAGSNSATSTPKNTAPVGRSPLIGPESTSSAAIPPPLPISTESLVAASQKGPPATIPTSHPANYNATTTTTTTSSAAPASAAVQPSAVDEAEWAAFEAEMADEPEPQPQPSIPAAAVYAQPSISAPALTAEQLAAKSQEEANERRKHLLEAEIADEREDATRALEAEFEEMEELEGRVRRLKERRDELLSRRGGANSGSNEVDMKTGDEVATAGKGSVSVGKENRGEGEEEEDDEDDEDDEEEDDWDAFRFRA